MQPNQQPPQESPKAPEQGKQPKAPKSPEQGRAYTKPGYEVQPGEENDVHVVIGKEVVRRNDQGRQVIETQPNTCILSPHEWAQHRTRWASLGFVFIEALHLPPGCEDGFAAPPSKI